MNCKAFSVLSILCVALSATAWAEGEPCGQVAPGYQGSIPEWPNEPVNFECGRGFSELSLCIINREGVEWLKNAGPQFIAINDGQAVYALTREGHPAYPMIVRRLVESDESGIVAISTNACAYGDKAAAEQLMDDYEKLDGEIMTRAQDHQEDLR